LILAALMAACSPSSAPDDAASEANVPDASDEAVAVDTWTNYAGGFFTQYCVECHTAKDTTGLDFTQYAIVYKNRATIRCGVCVQQDPSWSCAAFPPAKQFPINDSTGTNPKPSDAERDRLVAWIDAGAPQ